MQEPLTSTEPLAGRLAALSAHEMMAAAGLGGSPAWLRGVLALPLRALSLPIGRVLARFDGDIGAHGLPRAAAGALARFGATLSVGGAAPPDGPLLVIANHPGAYDALALMAALGRRDLRTLAAGRDFVGALPTLARDHVTFVPETAFGRVAAVRRAFAHLSGGGTILHFAAGAIEPDPAFAHGTPLLGPWTAGAATLVRATARAGGRVVVAGVRGVHSVRARSAWMTKLAERRGVTTFAPLLQVTVPGYRAVAVDVRLGEARAAGDFCPEGSDDAAITSALREALFTLLAAGARRA